MMSAETCHEHVVKVPGNSRPDGLLNVFAHPPVVLFLKVTDGNQTSTTAHCKLVLCKVPKQLNDKFYMCMYMWLCYPQLSFII